jgi:hypothetical protein
LQQNTNTKYKIQNNMLLVRFDSLVWLLVHQSVSNHWAAAAVLFFFLKEILLCQCDNVTKVKKKKKIKTCKFVLVFVYRNYVKTI